MTLQLSLGLASNPRTWPVINGQVTADGIAFIPTVIHPSELFWRQLRFADFDVSEMSMSSLLMTHARGDDRWLAIPVFTTRRFYHTDILVRRDAGITTPADLKGRRVGVPEYQQTAALWGRGILQHEFGVAPSEMEFWMERLPEHSHAGAVGFQPPAGVTIRQIPLSKSIGSMMLAGELDAAIYYIRKSNLVDRSTADLWNHPDIAPLFPAAQAENARYYAKTGIFPINHGMVIRRSIAERHPWTVLNILKMFNAANAIAERQRIEHVDYHRAMGLVPDAAFAALKQPLVQHGIKPNRATLEMLTQYSCEQGLTPHVVALEDVFASSVMDE
jgi:4,5-dihydroxyphthalate decarboxylase